MLRRIACALALCLLIAAASAAPAAAQLRADLVAGGLSQPVGVIQDPSDPTVQVVVQQNGRLRVLKSGVLQATDYLDLTGVVLNSGEQGLLGLAFAPDYAASGRVFVNFINLSGHTVVARFTRSSGNPLRAEPSSRFDLMWPGGARFIAQPFANHNGGHMAFGPDGFLYIGMGDGGSGNDPLHLAQDPQSLLGKMLRLDVSVNDADAEGYNVPASNPFAGQAGVLGEIWSFGWRNPWRWSFDSPARGGTGAMVAGDVGQSAWEEVNYEPAGRGGRNYGWRNREGAHNNITNLAPFSQPLVDPIHEYPHADGRSITGGYVYRGSAMGAAFRGRYFYADFVRSRVWSVRLTVNVLTGEATANDRIEHTSEFGTAASSPASFGEDASGELYLVSYNGSVYRIVNTSPPVSATGRQRPVAVAPIGWVVPRKPTAEPTAPAPPAKVGVQSSVLEGRPPTVKARTNAELRTPKSELSPCAAFAQVIGVVRALAARAPDDALVWLLALFGADVVGGDGLGCLLGRGAPQPDDLAFGHFTLRGGDGLERLADARDASAHQLGGTETRHDRELKLIHLDGTIDHGPSARLRPAMP